MEGISVRAIVSNPGCVIKMFPVQVSYYLTVNSNSDKNGLFFIFWACRTKIVLQHLPRSVM